MTYIGYAIAACWIVFLLVWIVSAFSTKATGFKPRNRRDLILRVLVICVLFAVVMHRVPGHALELQVIPHTLAWQLAALLLTAAGVGFAIWARFTLGRNWSSMPQVKQGHELIISGPYALARHPIYTGMTTALIGTALFFGQLLWLPALLLYGLFLFYKTRMEEELMMKTFPAQYPVYRRTVKAIIPGIL